MLSAEAIEHAEGEAAEGLGLFGAGQHADELSAAGAEDPRPGVAPADEGGPIVGAFVTVAAVTAVLHCRHDQAGESTIESPEPAFRRGRERDRWYLDCRVR